MYRVGILEFYKDMIKSLRWWKITFFILLTLCLIVINIQRREKDYSLYIISFYIPMWVAIMFKPKVSKLNYLLPGDSKSRIAYLKCSLFCILLFFILWYSIVYFINIIYGSYGISYALQKLFCTDLFIFIFIALYQISTSYLTKMNSTMRKTDNRNVTIITLLSIYPTSHAVLLTHFLHGYGYVISVLVSYICTVLSFYFALSVINNLDTSYENIRKPVKQSI